MKKSITTIIASAFVAGVLLTSCNTPAQKVENAEDNVAQAHDELDNANAEYKADMENYRRETADKISINQRSIAEFNARIANEKKDAQAEYRKKVAALEQKNSDMKMKLDNYKAEGKENWKKFKIEFNRDMEELGIAFKDLTVKNVK
jgi:F0F1-type ATP synthase membrane subunit b/b'